MWKTPSFETKDFGTVEEGSDSIMIMALSNVIIEYTQFRLHRSMSIIG